MSFAANRLNTILNIFGKRQRIDFNKCSETSENEAELFLVNHFNPSSTTNLFTSLSFLTKDFAGYKFLHVTDGTNLGDFALQTYNVLPEITNNSKYTITNDIFRYSNTTDELTFYKKVNFADSNVFGTVKSVTIISGAGLIVTGSPITDIGIIKIELNNILESISSINTQGLISCIDGVNCVTRELVAGVGIEILNPKADIDNPVIMVKDIPISLIIIDSDVNFQAYNLKNVNEFEARYVKTPIIACSDIINPYLPDDPINILNHLDLRGKQIRNLGLPTQVDHAVTKGFVENMVFDINSNTTGSLLIDRLANFPNDSTKYLSGNGDWQNLPSNNITLIGAVTGNGTGVINTEINPIQNIKSRELVLYFDPTISPEYNWDSSNVFSRGSHRQTFGINGSYESIYHQYNILDGSYSINNRHISTDSTLFYLSRTIAKFFTNIMIEAVPTDNKHAATKKYVDDKRLDEINLPTESVNLNNQKITNLDTGVLLTDAVNLEQLNTKITELGFSSLDNNGLLIKTANNNYVIRNIAVGSNLTISNSDGVSGDPLINLANNIVANSFTTTGGDVNATNGMLRGNNLGTSNATHMSVTSNFNMNNQYITNLGNPINNQDAVTKFYVDSIQSTSKSIMHGYMYQSQNTNLLVGDHIKFDTAAFTRGTNIILDSSTPYNSSIDTSSVGRITLTAGKTYKLTASSSTAYFASTNGYFSLKWYNITNNTPLGTLNTWWGSSWNYSSGGMVVAYISTTINTKVELRINKANSFSGIWGASDPNSATWFVVEEV